MNATVQITVDRRTISVDAGTSVAAARLGGGTTAFRTSVSGTMRGPLCGMGICHECRVTIDGVAHRRSCMIAVADGMQVVTDNAGHA
jgi:predicted molibdopterin-dependent oxidoreductase YjgC